MALLIFGAYAVPSRLRVIHTTIKREPVARARRDSLSVLGIGVLRSQSASDRPQDEQDVIVLTGRLKRRRPACGSSNVLTSPRGFEPLR